MQVATKMLLVGEDLSANEAPARLSAVLEHMSIPGLRVPRIGSKAAPRYSLYLLYWYKRTNADARDAR